jgi:hypothetical protein
MGLNVHMMAQMLLLRSYHRAARIRLDDHELLLALIHRFNSPVDWMRCAMSSRRLNAWMSCREQLEVWFKGYTPEARTDWIKFVIHHNVKFLLQPLAAAGGNVNCVFEQIWFRTPLHRAASRGHFELTKLLYALRADPLARDSHGAAPIHLCASKGRLRILDLMLQHDDGCAQAVDYSGRTPIHVAALKGHLAAVQLLVFARGSPGAQTHNGCTPMDMARRGQHVEITKFLESRQKRDEEALPAARTILSSLFTRVTQASVRQAPSAD